MRRAGTAVHESIHAVGRSSVDVGRLVEAAMADAGDAYRSARVGNDAFHLVRVYRPTWALLVGTLGLPVFGLGLLFFLVHKTESCTMTIVEGPTGAVVTVVGRLAADALDRVRAAITGRTSVVPERASTNPVWAPEPVASQPAVLVAALPGSLRVGTDTDETIAGSARPRVAGVDFPAHIVALRFDDGEVVPVTSTVVVGRDPSPTMAVADGAVRLVPVADQGVSKSHLRVRADHTGVWLEDLHSTNGTSIVHPGGGVVPVEPGTLTPLSPGSIVQFGGQHIEVVHGL